MNKLKALIVDDEKDIAFFLSKILTKKNFNTFITHNINDAATILKTEMPQIIVLDNHLPDGYGVNYVKSIKANYPYIKVIMITAYDTSQDRQTALQNGVDFFVSKPFQISQINAILATFSAIVE